MAYYTEYSTTVSYHDGNLITKADVANVMAGMLVDHAGFTLVTSATAGTASSATNYAEVSKEGIYIRFYSTDAGSLMQMTAYLAYSSNGTALTSQAVSFYDTNYTSVVVKLRFYAVKSGFCIHARYGTYASYTSLAIGVPVKQIADNAAEYCIGLKSEYAAYFFASDGAAATYYAPQSAFLGFSDAAGTVEFMMPLVIGTNASNNTKKYIADDVYMSSAFDHTGIISVGTRYFFVPAAYGLAVELTPT